MSAAPPRALAALAIVGLGASIAPLDFSVNVAFPAITRAFALDTRAIRWVAVCYVLTYGSLMLAFGALGDRIGHLRVFRAGVLLGALAFTLCALAPGFGWLLAARVLQGIAVALTLSCAPALATALFEESRRTWALSAYSGMSAFAGVVAPLVGGASIAALDWPGVYWFRVPIVLAAFFCAPLVARARAAPPARAPGAFDVLGAAMLAAAMALLLLGPSLLRPQGGAWPAAPLAGLGLAIFVAFVWRERGRAQPFLPHAVARHPDFVLPNLGSIVVQFTCFAIPLVVPYYMVRMGGWGPLQSGALLAFWAAGALLGSAFAARLVGALGVRRAAFAGACVVASGLAAIALWGAAPAFVPMVACFVFQGVGIGLYQVAYTDIVVAALPRAARGVAGSLTMVTRTIGIVSGASAWTWIQATFEARALAAGAAPGPAFMAGFQAVFLAAAAVTAGYFALTCVRPRTWFARTW
ncbi:MAG: MFS transporter [Burkholderiales bacterium]|nr:MFS transporter [Burkholderiales bacterium]